MKFHRYPKIFRVGHEKTQGIFRKGEIVVEEKMDGANVRWMYDPKEDRLRFGSRKIELTDAKDGGQFSKFIEWVKELDINDLEPSHIYYAEYMIPHTIQYDWDRTPMILGFDVLAPEGKFVNHDDAKSLFEAINVEFVPVIDVRKFYEIDDEYLNQVIPESRYYNGKAEGVVFKNYELQKFAKLVAEGFKEVNEQIFGKGKKKAKSESPEMYILEKYCPPRRIEKKILELEKQGHPLDMTMMSVLPKAVWEDLISEESMNILNENVTLNLPKLRKLIPKRCVNVLQRMMAMRELKII